MLHMGDIEDFSTLRFSVKLHGFYSFLLDEAKGWECWIPSQVSSCSNN